MIIDKSLASVIFWSCLLLM